MPGKGAGEKMLRNVYLSAQRDQGNLRGEELDTCCSMVDYCDNRYQVVSVLCLREVDGC